MLRLEGTGFLVSILIFWCVYGCSSVIFSLSMITYGKTLCLFWYIVRVPWSVVSLFLSSLEARYDGPFIVAVYRC